MPPPVGQGEKIRPYFPRGSTPIIIGRFGLPLRFELMGLVLMSTDPGGWVRRWTQERHETGAVAEGQMGFQRFQGIGAVPFRAQGQPPVRGADQIPGQQTSQEQDQSFSLPPSSVSDPMAQGDAYLVVPLHPDPV